MVQASSEAVSVAAALALAKGRLEGISLRIVGEVSELSNKPGYSAVYFTLKDGDEKAALPCLMWMNRYKAADVSLKVGALVEVTGRFSLYAPKGRMNFDVSSLTLSGEGDIRLRIAQLAKKLEAEGLMRPEAKLPVPAFPRRIGLVTSPRGAAVYDVLRTLRRRYPLAEVLVAGVPVEGKDAPDHLIAGLDEVQTAGVDVILLVRGGGSFEDLMPFNDERLARHIAGMPVPVITGIGHEPDTSIADMVSDMRASTPTAAAEAAAPSLTDISSRLHALARRLGFAQSASLNQARKSLSRLQSNPVLSDPMAPIRDEAQALDEITNRLEAALPAQLALALQKVQAMRLRLSQIGAVLLKERVLQTAECKAALMSLSRSLLNPFQERQSVYAAKLEGLSPLAIFSRGYAAVFTPEGNVVSSVNEVSVESLIAVKVSDGTMECRVEQIDAD